MNIHNSLNIIIYVITLHYYYMLYRCIHLKAKENQLLVSILNYYNCDIFQFTSQNIHVYSPRYDYRVRVTYV